MFRHFKEGRVFTIWNSICANRQPELFPVKLFMSGNWRKIKTLPLAVVQYKQTAVTFSSCVAIKDFEPQNTIVILMNFTPRDLLTLWSIIHSSWAKVDIPLEISSIEKFTINNQNLHFLTKLSFTLWVFCTTLHKVGKSEILLCFLLSRNILCGHCTYKCYYEPEWIFVILYPHLPDKLCSYR